MATQPRPRRDSPRGGRLVSTPWLALIGASILLTLSPLPLATAMASEIARVGSSDSSDQPTASMRQIFDAVAFLVSESLDGSALSNPAHAPGIRKRLELLNAASELLEQHAETRDPTFQFLASSLRNDVKEVRERFEAESYDEARFLIFGMTQNCVSCHSRQPNAVEFPLAAELTNSIDVENLERREIANLRFATRQFDAALDTFESAFSDRLLAPTELDFSGELADYLVLCLRVRRDPARALRGISLLLGRDDLPVYLRVRLDAWSDALSTLNSERAVVRDLPRARDLIARANRDTGFGGPRQRIVYDVEASGVLHALLALEPRPGPEMAEAYYLLGGIEMRSADSYWIPQSDFHLETAVRLAPGGPFAKPAFALLEESAVMAFGGTSDEWVPDEVRGRIRELEQLIKAGTSGASNGP